MAIKKPYPMKSLIKTYLLVPVSLFILFNAAVFSISFVGNGAAIEREIIKNIDIAKGKYSGTAEDALMAFLADTANTARDRSRVAVWTLGQIKSRKALSMLEEYYHDDPTGLTCHNHHDLVLCQSGLHRSIVAIESKWKMHQEFNK